MDNLRKAAEMALGALLKYPMTEGRAIQALRQALEQPEVWTQKHWTEYERSIAAAENEACAKVCDSLRPSKQEFDQRFYTACTLCADAIRARGE